MLNGKVGVLIVRTLCNTVHTQIYNSTDDIYQGLSAKWIPLSLTNKERGKSNNSIANRHCKSICVANYQWWSTEVCYLNKSTSTQENKSKSKSTTPTILLK